LFQFDHVSLLFHVHDRFLPLKTRFYVFYEVGKIYFCLFGQRCIICSKLVYFSYPLQLIRLKARPPGTGDLTSPHLMVSVRDPYLAPVSMLCHARQLSRFRFHFRINSQLERIDKPIFFIFVMPYVQRKVSLGQVSLLSFF
jgi:hypothetical protein